MGAHRTLVGLWIGLALFAAQSAGAFSIDGVVVSPPQPDSTTPVSLLVTFTSATAEPFLFAPTVVEIDDFAIDAELFVDRGLLTIAVTRTFAVDLGILSAGTYDFAVRLTPESDPPPPEFTGSFVVSEPDLALFVVAENPSLVDPCVRCDSFLLPLSDPNDIERARAIIAAGGAAPDTEPAVTVVVGSDGVNRDVLAPGEPLWSWHVTEFLGFMTIAIPEPPPPTGPGDLELHIAETEPPDGEEFGPVVFQNYTVVEEVPEPGSLAGALAAAAVLLALARRRQA